MAAVLEGGGMTDNIVDMGEIQRSVREEKYAILVGQLSVRLREVPSQEYRDAMIQLLIDTYDDGFDQGSEEALEEARIERTWEDDYEAQV
jgi:hypothetical protein